MKKLILPVLIIFVIASCRKEENVFNESPDQRLNATIAKYQAQLSGAQFGWKGIIMPKGGGSYGFFFEFNDSNRVNMISDFDSTSAVTFAESSYRLKGLQQPSLIFDTYSYVHVLSDPNESTDGVQSNINNGPLGQGLQSDFEFYFDSSSTDTIRLVGRFNGSKAYLVRATQAEQTSYHNGDLGKSLLFHNISGVIDIVRGKIFNYWKHFTLNNVTFEIDEHTFDPLNRTVRFVSSAGSGTFDTLTTTYHFGANAVEFDNPLQAGGQTIKGFTNLRWDNTTLALTATPIGGNTDVVIAGANSPLNVDLNAAATFRARPDQVNGYFATDFGFHVNGVFNANNITSLQYTNANGTYSYYYFIYYPSFGSNYDLLAPVFLDPSQSSIVLLYGWGVTNNNPSRPVVRADGTISFNFGNTPQLSNSPVTVPISGPFADMKALLRSTGGFYIVKTGEADADNLESYDMVSATDSKVWLTWFLLQ